MSTERVNPNLAAVEAALASLSPAPAGVDRDRLMFLAGSASARHSLTHWLWPAAAATTTLLSVLLTALLLYRPANVVGRPLAEVRPIPAAEAAAPLEQDAATAIDREPIRADYLVLRQRVLNEGVGALPPFCSTGTSSGPMLRAGSDRSVAIEALFDG